MIFSLFKLRLTGLLVVLFLGASCSSVEEDVDDLDLVRHLLNQQRYEEATEMLTRLLDESPSNDYLRLLLASSLAGSVGINTIDSFEALQGKLFNKPLAKGITSSSKLQEQPNISKLKGDDEDADSGASDAEAERSKVVAVFEKEILQFLSVGKDAMEIAFYIEHVEKDSRPKLIRALDLLDEIEESSDEYIVGQLYLAILDVVMFLNYFRDAMPYAQLEGENDWYMKIFCNLDIANFLDNISESTYFLSHAFTSLNNARRYSDSPTYGNIEKMKNHLVQINGFYLDYHEAFNLTDLAHSLSKHMYCQ